MRVRVSPITVLVTSKAGLEFEMHEDAPEILVVLLDAVVQLFYLGFGQEAQHAFFELPRALAGDDFHQRYAFFHRPA